MNIAKKIFTLIIILSVVLLALPRQALAAPQAKIIMGDSYTLSNGEVLDEDLVVFGGIVRLEEGSTVNGNVMLVGGTLWAAGRIQGDLTATGGMVSLQASAVITGNLSTLGSQVERNQDAVIEGETLTNQDLPFGFVPGAWQDRFMMPSGATPFLDLGWFFLRVVLWGLLAVLVVMFAPEATNRVSKAIVDQPIIAGGLGILTGIVFLALLVLLAVTICLIPISLLGASVLVVAGVFGWIAVGTEVGKRIGTMFNWQLHPAGAAGLGTLIVGLVAGGIGFIPCIGWIAPALVSAVGLGGVVLTRFGTRVYETVPVSIPAPVVEVPPPSPRKRTKS